VIGHQRAAAITSAAKQGFATWTVSDQPAFVAVPPSSHPRPGLFSRNATTAWEIGRRSTPLGGRQNKRQQSKQRTSGGFMV